MWVHFQQIFFFGWSVPLNFSFEIYCTDNFSTSTDSTRQVIALICCLCMKESCLILLLNYYFCDPKKKKIFHFVSTITYHNCTLNNIIAQPQKQMCTCMMGYSSISHQAKKNIFIIQLKQSESLNWKTIQYIITTLLQHTSE